MAVAVDQRNALYCSCCALCDFITSFCNLLIFSIYGIDLLCQSLTLDRSEQKSVGLKAPITVRDLHSEVRRDWIQLIGRKLAHTTAVKGRARRMPQEKGIPRKLELRKRQYNTLCRSLQNSHSNDYYIACAVTSNKINQFTSIYSYL
jgi:hypothetical protein